MKCGKSLSFLSHVYNSMHEKNLRTGYRDCENDTSSKYKDFEYGKSAKTRVKMVGSNGLK